MKGILNVEQEKAASQVRYMADGVNPEDIRPWSKDDDDRVKATRCFGMAVWQARESFVQFFSWLEGENFDADLFREKCTPGAPSLFDERTGLPSQTFGPA